MNLGREEQFLRPASYPERNSHMNKNAELSLRGEFVERCAQKFFHVVHRAGRQRYFAFQGDGRKLAIFLGTASTVGAARRLIADGGVRINEVEVKE